MRIVESSLAGNWERLAELLREHWLEIAKNKDLMVLNPKVSHYEQLERDGALLTLFAYDGEDLVGYSVSFLCKHLHYADLTYAQNDVLFVRASHRKGKTGLQLIRETERIAKDKGARMVIWHAKEGTTLEALLPRLGYQVQDVMFSREV